MAAKLHLSSFSFFWAFLNYLLMGNRTSTFDISEAYLWALAFVFFFTPPLYFLFKAEISCDKLGESSSSFSFCCPKKNLRVASNIGVSPMKAPSLIAFTVFESFLRVISILFAYQMFRLYNSTKTSCAFFEATMFVLYSLQFQRIRKMDKKAYLLEHCVDKVLQSSGYLLILLFLADRTNVTDDMREKQLAQRFILHSKEFEQQRK